MDGHAPCRPAAPRLYIVSDVRLFREGLVAALAGEEGLALVGAGAPAGALTAIATARPDIVPLDIAAAGALDLPKQATAVLPGLRVLAYAVAEAEADVLACAAAGICGYIPQDASVDDLVAAVHHAVSGELHCSPRIAAFLFRELGARAGEAPHGPEVAALTAREREIAGLAARGLANKEIARQLRLGHATIKNHVHNILQKLNVDRRGQIAGRLAPALGRARALPGRAEGGA